MLILDIVCGDVDVVACIKIGRWIEVMLKVEIFM